jgi:hypothetical protein
MTNLFIIGTTGQNYICRFEDDEYYKEFTPGEIEEFQNSGEYDINDISEMVEEIIDKCLF